MSVKQSHYEVALSEYSNRESAITLLKQHRPYLEMLPSMRRPDESLITIPLPVGRIRYPKPRTAQQTVVLTSHETIRLHCDLAIIMCDPEWKIKMGTEILVFIHRPQEDFSDLLSRWRETQVCLSQEYEWLMPARYEHILSDGAEQVHPLFVVFPQTPERIKRGLAGASLPFVVESLELFSDEEMVSGSLPVEG